MQVSVAAKMEEGSDTHNPPLQPRHRQHPASEREDRRDPRRAHPRQARHRALARGAPPGARRARTAPNRRLNTHASGQPAPRRLNLPPRATTGARDQPTHLSQCDIVHCVRPFQRVMPPPTRARFILVVGVLGPADPGIHAADPRQTKARSPRSRSSDRRRDLHWARRQSKPGLQPECRVMLGAKQRVRG